eukprot:CAMPEP_0195055764 /NCGR_PEP_ID=MMETSP0448-20130528/4367_1 /TAXON_ID=66468 /ORGANISM="Heterocapsa triquestra, Strain CCMP 448" /LENGTH=30 /DNA_ID= /DNA_START= /DNA_END= /DNA_ORIENTATION=
MVTLGCRGGAVDGENIKKVGYGCAGYVTRR